MRLKIVHPKNEFYTKNWIKESKHILIIDSIIIKSI
jgi:hypothetical protein